ncbi:MAG: hypothetical protein ACLFNO_02270 [Parcubacteria group bacterium]
MENAKDLKRRQKTLQEKMLSSVVAKHSTQNKQRFRLNGYLYDLRVGYNKDEFEIMPGEFILDEKNLLWICLGAGKAPDFGNGEVLWFLAEKDNVKFFDNFSLEDSTNLFSKTPSLLI